MNLRIGGHNPYKHLVITTRAVRNSVSLNQKQSGPLQVQDSSCWKDKKCPLSDISVLDFEWTSLIFTMFDWALRNKSHNPICTLIASLQFWAERQFYSLISTYDESRREIYQFLWLPLLAISSRINSCLDF